MIVLACVTVVLSAGIAIAVIRRSRRDELALRTAHDTLEERG